MQKWYQIFQRSTGLSPYVWVVFYILPFYFVFRSSTMYQVVIGIGMILGFFVCYLLSFSSKGLLVYFWTGVQILFSIAMTLMFGYVYFSLFLAFFIGNIRKFAGFITLYTIHLTATILMVYVGYMHASSVLITQAPFVFVCLIAVTLLPVTTYTRNKRELLQGELNDANKRISELVKLEERQRIARDLHDTLGQKLALIGLKSDLAGKLITQNPRRAESEIDDVRQTARIALKELRELVTQMRGTHVEDEIYRLRQILKAANIEFTLKGEPRLAYTSLLSENVVSMCLKEAVTNIVKHSSATACSIEIEQTPAELQIRVRDNGIGLAGPAPYFRGNGLRGMRERLEFVNGSLGIVSREGTEIIMKVPNVSIQSEGEAAL
ncbi:sensor histidine kinase [Cohnella thermotolerans]|uniref:sensor histidine kinase n=1 Tax=Cohnella thermotolerans TaxID=329858 RepID=UPI000405E8F5|nr:sensor histidine kinase [Cohnella thermotolerans]